MGCREKAVSASIRLVAGCKWQTALQVRCADDVVFAAEYWHEVSSKADVFVLMIVWRICICMLIVAVSGLCVLKTSLSWHKYILFMNQTLCESNEYLEIDLEMIIIS